MESLQITLPVVLLLMAFLLKLLIDRAATIPIFINSIFELPVDIAFLATSFIIAYTINPKSKTENGLCLFIVYTIVSIIVVFVWRRATLLFDQEHEKWAWFLSSINYVACITGIVVAIKLLAGCV